MSHEKPAWYLMKKPSKNINVHEYENIAERKNWSRRLQQFFRSFFCYTAILAAFLEFCQSIALRALAKKWSGIQTKKLQRFPMNLYLSILPDFFFSLSLFAKKLQQKTGQITTIPSEPLTAFSVKTGVESATQYKALI